MLNRIKSTFIILSLFIPFSLVYAEYEIYNELQKDVVIVESIWPSENFIEGLGINALVSSDPGHGIGGAVFHDTAIWIKTDS